MEVFDHFFDYLIQNLSIKDKKVFKYSQIKLNDTRHFSEMRPA